MRNTRGRNLNLPSDTNNLEENLGPDVGYTTTIDHALPLKVRDQWICSQYRSKGENKKPSKVPIDPTDPNGLGIDSTNPRNWMSYEEAKSYYEENPFVIDHYGFVTCDTDPYCFIDIDERIDKENGEVPPLIMKLVNYLDSYAYRTPNEGVRIVVNGELKGTGGNYIWVDPDTNEDYTFEVYDRKRYLVFTDRVFHDRPIREAQSFLDSLKKKPGTGNTGRNRVSDVPEVELPENLEEARSNIKLLLTKHDLDPNPILEGSRKITLISSFRKIVRNEPIGIAQELGADAKPDELWTLLNMANETLLYDEDGEYLKSLDREELKEIYDAVTKDLPQKSPKEVQEKLDELLGFLVAIKVHINYRQDSKWKILKALEEHGRKYGCLLSENEIRVDIGWVTLKREARIGSNKTLSNTLMKLKRTRIIRKGWDKGDRTGHFVIDLRKVMASYSSWGIDEKDFLDKDFYAQGNKGEKNLHHPCTPVHNQHIQVPTELREAITHTTWYRRVGPTKIRYVLALLSLGGKATSTEIAKRVGVKPSSVSRPLRELKVGGVIHQDKERGPYKVNDKVADDLFRFRSEKGEFCRDEEAQRQAKEQRRFWAYQLKLQNFILDSLEDGLSPDQARKEAEDLVLPPKGIGEYELHKRQEWAFKGAQRERASQWEKNESRGRNHPKPKGRDNRVGNDVRLRKDIKEGYFQE